MNSREAGSSGRWHQALAYAVTGRRLLELGEQNAPDLALLRRQLESAGEVELMRAARSASQSGEGWPHPVPPELMAGLGYAQFSAALAALQGELGLSGPTVVASATTARAASPAEQRLLDDVPPHHGS